MAVRCDAVSLESSEQLLKQKRVAAGRPMTRGDESRLRPLAQPRGDEASDRVGCQRREAQPVGARLGDQLIEQRIGAVMLTPARCEDNEDGRPSSRRAKNPRKRSEGWSAQ
jgi:hypothetical protein